MTCLRCTHQVKFENTSPITDMESIYTITSYYFVNNSHLAVGFLSLKL
nr:MAG TPA: hypothetical protein [Caudoviricetes sp.]